MRDAAHILGVLEAVRQHARHAEDRVQFEQWRPHLTGIQAAARAMAFLEKKQYGEAMDAARQAIGTTAADACARNEGMLAEALLERARGALATCPTLHPHEECSFLRRDDYWTIRYHGHTAFLKATRGLQCLAVLLRTPGREFHVSELAANLHGATGAASVVKVIAGRRAGPEQFVTAGLYDGHPVLDGQARAEYKRRLRELRQELGEAERFNDPDRAASARDEMEAIAQHIASAVGLGGRERKTSSDAERARCAVTKRIKQAIHRIGEAIPALGHHLSARLKTGYFCSYNPHPERPVTWKF